jgi:hypothetical protein
MAGPALEVFGVLFVIFSATPMLAYFHRLPKITAR